MRSKQKLSESNSITTHASEPGLFVQRKYFFCRTNKKSDLWNHKQRIFSVKPNRKSKNLRLSNEKLQTRDQIIGSDLTN